MSPGTHIVKRHTQHSEPFDPMKLHASLVAACLAVRAVEGEAHLAAQHTCRRVIDWLETRPEVTSDDIRRIAARHLATYHAEAAYLYGTYTTTI
jgi:transcriptional regulator NrdR family protein